MRYGIAYLLGVLLSVLVIWYLLTHLLEILTALMEDAAVTVGARDNWVDRDGQGPT
jgi:hypothetical protein